MSLPGGRCLSLTLAASLALGGCALQPPAVTPEDAQALARARRQATEADAKQATVTHERSAYAAEIETKQAKLDQLDSPFQASAAAHRERAAEYEAHEAALAGAEALSEGCSESADLVAQLDRGAELAALLGGYASDPTRDAALAAMERCRVRLVKALRKDMEGLATEFRPGFAREVEDMFDEHNPYSRGDLSAKVSGTKLHVTMRGNFEGRARHSQDQVDFWCGVANGMFTEITLKNSHGTFKCSPAESPKQFVARVLDEGGRTSSWVATGERPIPDDPGPAPVRPPGLQSQRNELVAEIARLQAASEGLDARARDATVAADQARQSQLAVEHRQAVRVETWGVEAERRASRTAVAGGILAGVGALGLAITVGAHLDQPSAATKQALPIGIAVSVPVIVTGVALLIGGNVRKARVREKLDCVRGGGCG